MFKSPSRSNGAAAHYAEDKICIGGKSKEEIKESVSRLIEKKDLPELEPGAMSYMMSKQGRLNDRAGHWVPHLMFYVSVTDNMTWGADLDGFPVFTDPLDGVRTGDRVHGSGSEWSDGTPAEDLVH